MKKLIQIFCFAFVFIGGSAQHVIYFNDQTYLKVRVKSVGEKYISYKLFDNRNGPIYFVDKSKVKSIVKSNGKFIDINKNTVTIKELKSNNNSFAFHHDSLKSNLVGWNYFELLFLDVNLFYERFLYKNHFGIRFHLIPGIPGANSEWNFYELDRNIGRLVLGLNYYALPRARLTYFTGVNILAGIGENFRYSQTVTYNPYVVNITREVLRTNYFGLHLLNGFHFNITNTFNLKFAGFLGFVKFTDNQNFDIHVTGEVSACIRF